MISRRILLCRNHRCMGVGIQRATIRTTIQPIIAAVGFLSIEPDQPGSIDFLHTGDLTGSHIGHRTGLVGTGSMGFCLYRSFTFQPDIQCLLHAAAIWCGIAEHRCKIVIRLHINARGRSRSFHITAVQEVGSGLFIGEGSIIIQQCHIIRQNDLRGTAIGGILHLQEDRHNSEVFAILSGYCNGLTIRVQCIRIHIPALCGCLVIIPQADTDFGVTGCNRKTITSHIAVRRGIRKIPIQHLVDFIQIRRRTSIFTAIAFARNRRFLDGRLHGNDQCSQRGISGRYCFVCLFFL